MNDVTICRRGEKNYRWPAAEKRSIIIAAMDPTGGSVTSSTTSSNKRRPGCSRLTPMASVRNGQRTSVSACRVLCRGPTPRPSGGSETRRGHLSLGPAPSAPLQPWPPPRHRLRLRPRPTRTSPHPEPLHTALPSSLAPSTSLFHLISPLRRDRGAAPCPPWPLALPPRIPPVSPPPASPAQT
jgi:hypothetical protein